MDGREAIPSSYYIQHRGVGGGSSTGTQTGLHGPPPVIRSMPNPSPSPSPSPGLPAAHHPGGGVSFGSAFQMDTLSSVSPHAAAGAAQGEPAVKRKRGRPRKYGPEGTMALALSSLSSTPTGSGSGSVSGAASASVSGSAGQMQKRGRGRPPGSGRKQQLASLGGWIAGSAGMGFTPHIITIPVGEDIATKIMSFSQQGPRAVCILSANGSVSTATLCQPLSSGGTVTYEGRFEILCLCGSYLLTDNGGSRSINGGLSVSLASPDGRVIGGGVGGVLRAASPVQVIVGSFLYGSSSKKKGKSKTGQESGHGSELPMGDGQQQSTPASAMLGQNLSPSSAMGGWTGSRQMEMKNTHIDIDLTRG